MQYDNKHLFDLGVVIGLSLEKIARMEMKIATMEFWKFLWHNDVLFL